MGSLFDDATTASAEDMQKLVESVGINQKNIQGQVYELEPLSTTPAIRLWERLATVMTPTIGVAIDKLRAGEFELPVDHDAFRHLGITLIQGLGEVQFASTCKDMLTGLKCNGQDVDYEKHFKGKLGLLMEVLAYSFEVNFSDFFTTLLRMMGVSEIPTLKEIMSQVTPKEEKLSPSGS